MYTAIDKAGVKYIASKQLKQSKSYSFLCPNCGGKVSLKAGDEKRPHFAHEKNACDYFDYKGMSDWHLNWQSLFDKNQREVSVFNEGKKHIADVINSNGVVIEFQNSPISITKKSERDGFYHKLIWVVNAKGFDVAFKTIQTQEYKTYLKDCDIRDEKISRINKAISDLSFYKSTSLTFNLDISKEINEIKLKYQNVLEEITQQNKAFDGCMHETTDQIEWKYERKIWTNSLTPVFLDFGSFLGLLKGDCRVVRISRDSFLEKYCI